MHLGINTQQRPAYVLLITVLTVGIITSTVAIAILLLGLSVERNAYSLQVSTQAYEFTMSCIERAIDKLRDDLEYQGNEQIQVPIASGYGYGYGGTSYGICTIRPIKGFWNNDRTICVEAVYGNFTKRRQEIVVNQVLPDTKIESWEEVPFISLCESYRPQYCGNGTVETSEQCDNAGDSAVCNANCTFSVCGDGYVNTVDSEDCDTEGESAICDADCTVTTCGDGYRNTTAGEDCDSNGVDSATCNFDCTEAICGDGYRNSVAGEQCDGDNAGTGGETASCDSDCTNVVCGDGLINISAGEECDGGPSCSGTCTIITSYEPTDYVAYWKLDESSDGSDAVDEVNSYVCDRRGGADVGNSTPNVPSAISGSPVNSTYYREFDGNNDYLRCDNSSVFSPEPITVSFWVYATDEPDPADGIICATSSNWDRGWGFTFEDDDRISFFVQDWWTNWAEASIDPEDNWNHVLGSWDGNTIKIYVNGALGYRTDTYNGSMTPRRLEIGRCSDNDYILEGNIDDVRIYDRILTPDEIASLATGN